MDTYNLSVPMKLDAFVLNPDVCDQDARIAPITQPNYTFLRIENFVLQNDTLDHVDVHNAKPAKYNQRVTSVLGSEDPANLRSNRLGVYVHWILPRLYRIGASATPESSSNQPGSDSSQAPAPTYPNTPNRWLVIRTLDPNAITTVPNPLPAGCTVPAVDAWILESDTLQYIDNLDDDADLQVDVSPFIASTATNAAHPDETSIEEQAEVFIGKRQLAAGWTEKDPSAVNLSLLNSSNQLFPDYQPHNSNVFSMIDTFQYYDAKGQPAGSLTDAVADYYVIGWHSDRGGDPFGDGKAHQDVLGKLPLNLRDSANFNDWLTSTAKINTICHGAMYGVEWHMTWSKDTQPKNLPANDFSVDLANEMQVAVGTTTLDALLSYLEAHHEGEYENDVRLLGDLLRAQSDSASGQLAGSDEVQNYNFSRVAGGKHYTLPIDANNPATPPSPDDIKNLKLLNQAQFLYDGASRMLQQKQWDTFSLWWQFVTDIDNTDSTKIADYRTRAGILDTARGNLIQIITDQTDAINTLKDPKNGYLSQTPKEATHPEYSAQRDPTLFVGKLGSGWPVDFLDSLLIRLDTQIATYGQPDTGQSSEFFLGCLPPTAQATGLALIQEFLANKPPPQGDKPSDITTTTASDPPPTPTYPPLYHDQGPAVPGQSPPADTPWRDRWESTQPWFPLFMEWEAEYHHVDYSYWALKEQTARGGTAANVRYGLPDDVQYDKLDTRTLSGRILLLPQPSFSLKGQLEQLFSSTPASILDPILSKDERDKLLLNVAALPFASSPLDGFTNHLITLAQGSHLKPNVRVPAAVETTLLPLQEAYKTSANAGLGIKQIQAIDVQSDLTPYATLVSLGSAKPAFKPATHGQFRMTKLNIIDKFGQTACAIDPTPTLAGPPPLYPCISDYYEPQMLPDGYANVAIPQKLPGICEFMQVSPAINQSARLDASFVISDTSQPTAYWRPTTEWENPIWGWVVVNYVDNGIQFFTSEGEFYCEVRIAAPNNPHPTSAGPTWLPFKPSSTSTPETQLGDLILKLIDPVNGEQYLKAFIDMINTATSNSTAAPSAYNQFINALIGKPLALANIGVSLELAADAKVSQTQLKSQQGLPQPYALLEKDTNPHTPQYTFPFKLGDKARPHDGLVGYFRAFNDPAKYAGKELDTSKFYTSYADPDGSIVFPISNTDGNKYPILSSFWLNPVDYEDPEPDPNSHYIGTAKRYEDARNNQLVDNVFGCIMDPFLPVNVYTSILPVKPLTLPNWTWESALKTMTAFFHFGPLMVTNDVPAQPPPPNLSGDPTPEDKPSGVKLPSVKVAEWNWLQPYFSNPTAGSEFTPLGVAQVDSRPRYEKGPYTAIEGYLQMKAPIFAAKGN
ncbi:hypothetical protein TWF694_005835 [Orbilia ellipsospora]|uniref:Uncharacterized protein n=1 Tax=Orbilia ellipsospora TaxID=2528407 RepID=A0AAV9WTP8_9PEZI